MPMPTLKELAASAFVKTGQYGPLKLGWKDYDEIEYAQICYNNERKKRFNVAVRMGRLDLLIRLIKDGHTWDFNTCNYIIGCDNLLEFVNEIDGSIYHCLILDQIQEAIKNRWYV